MITEEYYCTEQTQGPETVKLFSCSTQLNLIFALLITFDILILIIRINFMLSSVQQEKSKNFSTCILIFISRINFMLN